MQRIYQEQEMLLVGKKQEVMVELRRLMMRHGGNTSISELVQQQANRGNFSKKQIAFTSYDAK
ncbi:hypothetical protein M5X00_09600 [Paenibacillus alvei]|uniref:hypothetical protein n=1 Tax=Paenibacillus TaxID=44249 RepID=UPI0002896E1B|nr:MULTISPECIES: hypothetical protein [Paenibacillus]EJW18063.1 hypothetical protein PAV_3c05130 [Paenibacillus alvei DSM 29]MCY7487375.1 hypothetical protein [Paenibacillus alvei]MCY9542115.1 hypothetical protein [Paenibacillus alvei]MCY9703559.1 hypothetical protein [Paenibacillus alvei]MCY9732440.1 hypothetical protein [Paenibacillus alvei]